MEQESATAHAPGRVNLVGEHTDYNDGLCLPFAVRQGVTARASAAPSGGGRIEAHALDLGESDAFDAADPPPANGWRAFVRGTVAELRAAGHAVGGARIEIAADLPRGAGLSSSAALTAALALALLGLAGEEPPDRLGLARLLQRVENRWAGADTGLLDQIASLCSPPDGALLLDCRTLATEPVPLALGGFRLAVADSGASRDNAGSGYGERRAECRRACELLGVGSLREADPRAAERLPPPLDRRVRHVLEENARVREAAAALRRAGAGALGPLLLASHASLRDLYDASVPAVEATLESMLAAGAAGARMMGGGFGGAVLALFPPGAEPPADALPVEPGPPARLLEA